MAERILPSKPKPDAPAASALRVAEKYPAFAPMVERVFKRICPTLELINFDFGADRADGWRNYAWILLSGAESELLGLGIIEAAMIPVRPKRVVYFPFPCWTVIVKRHAQGRLSVRMDLNEDTLDRAHPLAPLASYNWQALVDQSEPAARIRGMRPSYLRLVVDNTQRA